MRHFGTCKEHDEIRAKLNDGQFDDVGVVDLNIFQMHLTKCQECWETLNDAAQRFMFGEV